MSFITDLLQLAIDLKLTSTVTSDLALSQVFGKHRAEISRLISRLSDAVIELGERYKPDAADRHFEPSSDVGTLLRTIKDTSYLTKDVGRSAKQKRIEAARRLLVVLAIKFNHLKKVCPPNGWARLGHLAKELAQRAVGMSEMSKMNESFLNKINGRLAMLTQTNVANAALSESQIAKRHGQRLAKLVAGGDQSAIRLIELTEERDAYRAGGSVDLNVLGEYEYYIGQMQSGLNICNTISEAAFGVELTDMMRTAIGGFSSQDHFKQNLCEGLLLNVNTLAANTLMIPPGEYVVWTTDAGHTMLSPTSESVQVGDSVGKSTESYDVTTPNLVRNWNKLERMIGEKKDKSSGSKKGGKSGVPWTSKSRKGLPNLRLARERAGKSLRDVADEAGIGVSTLAKHELGFANPLKGTMDKIMGVLNVDPDAFHKSGVVEPYKHIDSEADNIDPYNVGVSHEGSGKHHA